ncbi:MAG: hypothetical protein CFH41_01362 [Alphaproteobacteria bacterium MarineAlpha11_Bin1]|nr:MAG: hypothetical protein CFH41_01362 [Alphaproteobacteria bacterium MarineAlpha11_Bin1]|tara:strand:- start:18064 stop:18483 length:420 start_codon:yes stop_codon:yes gene_type:complete
MHEVSEIKDSPLRLLICRWVLVVILLALLTRPAISQTFFSAIEDLPLAPGLSESVDEGVRFDSLDGRIVTAIAYGAGDIAAYRGFYDKALPSLGWQRYAVDVYRRDKETLRLQLKRGISNVEVRIRVVPVTPENASKMP